MEEEITREAFKALYFEYATPDSGWTEDYWNHFYENETGKRYFFSSPASTESTRMFIISDSIRHRMIFLAQDAEESFFDFPVEE